MMEENKRVVKVVQNYLMKCRALAVTFGRTDDITSLQTLKGVRLSRETLLWFDEWTNETCKRIGMLVDDEILKPNMRKYLVMQMMDYSGQLLILGRNKLHGINEVIAGERVALLSAVFDCRLVGYWDDNKGKYSEEELPDKLYYYTHKALAGKLKDIL